MTTENTELKTELEDAIDVTRTPIGDDELFDTENDDFGTEIGAKAGAEPEQDTQDAPEPEPAEPTAEAKPDADSVEPEEAAETDPAPAAVEPAESEESQNDIRIPKSRFDQVNERRKAAEQRLAELEKAQAAANPATAGQFDFEGREKAYMEAVLDGETDKALAIRNEIRSAESALLDIRLSESRAAASKSTQAELELKTTIETLQTEYPVFNGESEVFDQDVTDEALELFQGFQKQGYDPATAMQRAVRYTVKMHDLDAPAPAPAPAAAPEAATKAEPKASPDQVKAKLDIATQQPPIPAGRAAERAPDIAAMPEDQFDKLSKQDEAVLRGDFVG